MDTEDVGMQQVPVFPLLFAFWGKDNPPPSEPQNVQGSAFGLALGVSGAVERKLRRV